MTVLTRDVILSEIDNGRIRIDPFERSQVGVASIDLTLGREIRAIENDSAPIRVDEETENIGLDQSLHAETAYISL